jgi:hypothetical protein
LATKFYFPDTADTSGLTPTISAEWEHQNVIRRDAVTTPDASALATTAYNPDGADHIFDYNAHHRQYITGPLAAQTIAAQAVTAQFQCLESHASDNLKLTIKIFSIDSAGSVKDTLLAITRAGTEPTTSLRNTSFSGTTTERTVVRGDRLVFEIGLGGLPTSGSGANVHNGSIRFGCSAAAGDLLVNKTEAGTTYRPWLNFANNMPLDIGITPPAGGLTASVVAGVLGFALLALVGETAFTGYSPTIQIGVPAINITPSVGSFVLTGHEGMNALSVSPPSMVAIT